MDVHWLLELRGLVPGILVFKHTFLYAIRKDDMKTAACQRGTLTGKSPPMQVKKNYSNSKWLLVGLHLESRICLECL